MLKLHPCGPDGARAKVGVSDFYSRKPGVDLEYCGYPTPLWYQTGILRMPNFVNRIVLLFFFPVLFGFNTIPNLVAYTSFCLIPLYLPCAFLPELGYKGNSPICSNPERSSCWKNVESPCAVAIFFLRDWAVCKQWGTRDLWGFTWGRKFWTCWPNMTEVRGLNSGKTKVNLYNCTYNKQSSIAEKNCWSFIAKTIHVWECTKLHYPDVAKRIQATWFVTRLKWICILL